MLEVSAACSEDCGMAAGVHLTLESLRLNTCFMDPDMATDEFGWIIVHESSTAPSTGYSSGESPPPLSTTTLRSSAPSHLIEDGHSLLSDLQKPTVGTICRANPFP
jgi:hypothetical protein